jgi:hypothetical protein
LNLSAKQADVDIVSLADKSDERKASYGESSWVIGSGSATLTHAARHYWPRVDFYRGRFKLRPRIYVLKVPARACSRPMPVMAATAATDLAEAGKLTKIAPCQDQIQSSL